MPEPSRGGARPEPPPDSSPSALAERLRARLLETPWGVDFDRLEVCVLAEEVRLVGCVATYHVKQMAQTILAPHCAGRRLQNELTVQLPRKGPRDLE